MNTLKTLILTALLSNGIAFAGNAPQIATDSSCCLAAEWVSADPAEQTVDVPCASAAEPLSCCLPALWLLDDELSPATSTGQDAEDVAFCCIAEEWTAR